MIALISNRASWDRIVENAKPQWIVVTDNEQWFRGGTGITYRFRS
jgi:SLT domain-containing protein